MRTPCRLCLFVMLALVLAGVAGCCCGGGGGSSGRAAARVKPGDDAPPPDGEEPPDNGSETPTGDEPPFDDVDPDDWLDPPPGGDGPSGGGNDPSTSPPDYEPVPEPVSMLTVATGLSWLGVYIGKRRRRKR